MRVQRTAEMGSGTFTSGGEDLAMDGQGRYAFLTYVACGPHGIFD